MHPMTIHSTQTASPESATLLAGVESQIGFSPNVFAIFAASTPALAAFVDLNGHFGASSLSATQREVVQLVASTENECGYCVKMMSNLASNAFSIPVDDAFSSCTWIPSAERE